MALVFIPFNRNGVYGYVQCHDELEQEQLISFAKWCGNYEVRAAMLCSIIQTSSNAPCVVNLTERDVAAFNKRRRRT